MAAMVAGGPASKRGISGAIGGLIATGPSAPDACHRSLRRSTDPPADEARVEWRLVRPLAPGAIR